jgi:hypothetical protein
MTRASDARHDLECVVWPLLERVYGGTLTVVEWEPGKVAADLDREAGIDFCIKLPGRGMLGFASRIQWRHYAGRSAPWHKGSAPMTFTCRATTEVPKRVASIEHGGMVPSWTLQAFLDRPGGPLENVAWTPTDELYRVVVAGNGTYTKVNGFDGTPFVVVPWQKVSGYRYFRPPPPPAQPTLWESVQ